LLSLGIKPMTDTLLTGSSLSYKNASITNKFFLQSVSVGFFQLFTSPVGESGASDLSVK